MRAYRTARTTLRGGVYWMGISSFPFVLSGGGVRNISMLGVGCRCFQNLGKANQTKCVAGPNSTFDEIWFFFPSIAGGTGECDTYVKYNTDENGAWDYGTAALGMDRPVSAGASPRSLRRPPASSISMVVLAAVCRQRHSLRSAR